MPFPKTERIIYQNNPLINVICQLRFPPILKIDNELPALFQDAIRETYPNYNEQSGLLQISEKKINIREQEDFFDRLIGQTILKEHKFSSADNIWTVVITRTFLALSSTRYEKWEDFREKLEFVFKTFNEIYKPGYYTRLGLRYIDVIDRAKLNLSGIDWSELLENHILGIISTPQGKYIKNFDCKYEIELEDSKSQVALKTSFVRNRVEINGENCFVIDSDFFNSYKTDTDDIFVKLNYLHDRATRLIRWIIKDKLHIAMNPIEIKD